MPTAMVLHLETKDYDAWKQVFDSDPAGRRQAATGHVLSRGVDNPNSVFVRATFDSVEEAQAFRQRLHASGARDNPDVTIVVPPTVIQVAEEITY